MLNRILEEQKSKVKKRGIAAIDIDERKIIDVVAEGETLSLLQELSKRYSNRRIYLLKTDAKSPGVE